MREKRTSTELIHQGKYAAEMPIELHYSDESRSPTMSLDDARKLEAVRLALQRGDIAEASKYGRVFRAETGGGGVSVARLERSESRIGAQAKRCPGFCRAIRATR
jgi:hypothetical protein